MKKVLTNKLMEINMDTEDNRVNMNVRNVNEQLKRDFKAYCVKRGKTLSEELQRLMKEELEKAKKKGL